MKQKTRNISVLIIAATIALAVFTASAAADTTTEYVVNISVTSPNTYFPAPEPITVPENITELRVSADTTDMQIDIHLYDPSGRHTGATYPTGEETNIPNSTYSGWNTDPEVITVTNPAAGNYTLKAYGFFATGWANVGVTIVPRGEKAHITGRVMERLPDETLEPLGGVTVTAYDAVTMDVVGTATTNSDGYFTVDVPPYSVVDLKFTKAGYKDRSEEGIDLTDYGPCETYDIGTMFMTRTEVPPPEYCVNITADPPMSQSVCVNEDATYILTVCNCANISDEIVLSITVGPGTLNKTTFSLDPDKCDVAELTVNSPTPGIFDTTVRATSQGNTSVYDEVTVTTTVMGANLKVFVRDYVTGNLVGTFSKTNTTAGTECDVPELWVEVKDITGELIKGKFTTNGVAEFCIPPATYSKVNVFANNKSIDEWYMPNVDKPQYYVPWIEPGSESGVTISPTPNTALIYVGVKEPPVHYLTVNAITSIGNDKKITVNTAEDVTAEVTGSYTYDGRTVTENIPHANVTLDGAGVHRTGTTNSAGIVTFSAVTPTIVEDITVTATKPPCFVGDTDTIEVIKIETKACPVIEVRAVDAEHNDNSITWPPTGPPGVCVALYTADGDMITVPIPGGAPDFICDNETGDSDPTGGVILIDTDHIDLGKAIGKGPFYLVVTDKAGRYNDYVEQGIDLSAQLACTDPPAPVKKKTAPMTE